MNDLRLILASGSPRRREILEKCGISFTVLVSDLDERMTKADPSALVMELSEQKAEDVRKKLDGERAMILAADTVVALDGRILGKPADEEDAHRMLSALSGRIHQVYTGVTLLIPDGESIAFFERTDVSIYPLTDEEICSYIKGGEPMDKAGAYGIQGAFARYVKRIEGDYFNVVGLPVARLYQECKKRGIVL